MSLCAYCGHATVGAWCDYHANVPDDDDWATGNRAMCDFVHRGIVPPASSVRPRHALDALFDRRQTPMVA
jgi:hypothetical protein